MKLVIGGFSQGKLEFVLNNYDADDCVVYDGILPDKKQWTILNEERKKVIINHFHSWVRDRILHKGDPEKEIELFLKINPESIIISDEIGNGIVPMDAFEREYRERTGRILVKLAGNADEVVRVICGVGQKIK